MFMHFHKGPITHFRSKQVLIISFVPGNWVLISLEKYLHLVKSRKPSCLFLFLHPRWSCALQGCGGTSEVPGLLVFVYREACGSPWRAESIRPHLFLFHKGFPGASSVITLLLGRQRRSRGVCDLSKVTRRTELLHQSQLLSYLHNTFLPVFSPADGQVRFTDSAEMQLLGARHQDILASLPAELRNSLWREGGKEEAESLPS